MPASGGRSAGADPPRGVGGRELALALVSLVLGLLVLDAGLRLRYRLTHGGEPLSSYFRHDPLLGWSHRPGARAPVGFPEAMAEVAISAAGLRDRERAPLPPPGTLRILAVGDAFVEGWAVAEAQGVAPRGRALHPELVLLFFCGNDVVYNARADYWRGAKPYLNARGHRVAAETVARALIRRGLLP